MENEKDEEEKAEEIANRLNPPRCPECGRKIEALVCWSKVWAKQIVYAHPEYEIEWSACKRHTNHTPKEFRCPKCDEVIFENEDKAKEFLRRVEL